MNVRESAAEGYHFKIKFVLFAFKHDLELIFSGA